MKSGLSRSERIHTLKGLLEERILVADGAMGTRIQNRNLSAQDFGGAALEGCNEHLVLTAPRIIQEIHEEYVKAGADIVFTNTFGATPLVLAEYGLEKKAHEINVAAAQLARAAAGNRAFVAGSMGPTTKAMTVTGGVTFPELIDHYFVQAQGLHEGGVDYFLLETCQDTRNIKAAFQAIENLFKKGFERLPVAVSITIEPTGTMLAGQSAEAAYISLSHHDLLYFGLNCATGPEFMTDSIRSLHELSQFPLACVPNAGLPDEEGQYLETPSIFCGTLRRFLESGWLNVVGGCCGTEPAHIEAMVNLVSSFKPRRKPTADFFHGRSFLSGVDSLELTNDMRPLLVGERTNVIGSRRFKTLVQDNKWDEASEIGRSQVKGGAHIVDVCLANPDRDELEDMRAFLQSAIQKIRAPLMIDSTDAAVIADALTYSQGKAVINSINLEDGEERFESVVPLGKSFGAAFVVGTIDDDPIQGMGISCQRKLEIAERSFNLLTQKYKIPAEDIYFDPLVFPCGTGDEQYKGSALETINGIREIKKKFPQTKTILGISNVSFGLPNAGREVLNSVFLYHCVQAGLDLAIVNTEKLERYAQIPEEERKLSENLLFNTHDSALNDFHQHFKTKTPQQKPANDTRTLDERLASYIIEGKREGLVADLDLKLKELPALEIINGPLMKGMDEVGRLFNANQLIVAEVLQSAEAMKAAVAHLEPYLEKNADSLRGKVLLATVKGDVHDIGKNLVEIILANNGFKVINLGIKVLPEALIQAAREHQPQIIGLSGLLVKSAQQMVLTVDDFSKAGINVPVLVGGAALTEKFVDKKIAPAYHGFVSYAPDAMDGLDQAKKICDKKNFPQYRHAIETKRATKSKDEILSFEPQKPLTENRRSREIEIQKTIPTPPDFKRHILKSSPIDQIWDYVNPLMLYTRHLGVRGGIAKKCAQAVRDPKIRLELEKENPREFEIFSTVEAVKDSYRHTNLLSPAAVYQFFQAISLDNHLRVWGSDPEQAVIFDFPRQNRAEGLCLSDFINPEGEPPGGETDNLVLFAVTVGRNLRLEADALKNKGEYLKSHILSALAIETAEAYAELLHAELRKFWGFSDPAGMTMIERFQARYRGKRYSFGYPACPNLDDQEKLFQLLRPQDIGIELTEGMMMDPEASVSAIVFHHPQALYFSVGGGARSNGE